MKPTLPIKGCTLAERVRADKKERRRKKREIPNEVPRSTKSTYYNTGTAKSQAIDYWEHEPAAMGSLDDQEVDAGINSGLPHLGSNQRLVEKSKTRTREFVTQKREGSQMLNESCQRIAKFGGEDSFKKHSFHLAKSQKSVPQELMNMSGKRMRLD